MAKFVFITREQYEQIGQMFEKRDPSEHLKLRSFGEFSDIASYSPKYDTIVFNTVRNGEEKDRFSKTARKNLPF